jgi:hypothetical protein
LGGPGLQRRLVRRFHAQSLESQREVQRLKCRVGGGDGRRTPRLLDSGRKRSDQSPRRASVGSSEVDPAALEACADSGMDLVEDSLPDLRYDSLMNVVYAETAAGSRVSRSRARTMISPGKAKMRSPTSSARRAFFRRSIRATRPAPLSDDAGAQRRLRQDRRDAWTLRYRSHADRQ